MENEKEKNTLRKKMKTFLNKIKGMKKRYYVIFGLLAAFFIYNTITLRGFFYDNYSLTFFGFMDSWHGYTDAVDRSFRDEFEGMRGYVAEPSDIHDIENSREWYVSIFGTVVFMKWKWVGLHIGDYMVLIDTWVPRGYHLDNHIFGHPYYLLQKYDSVENYPFGGEKKDEIMELILKYAKNPDPDASKKARHWGNNYKKYRAATIVFYCAVLVIIVVMVVMGIRRRKKRKKDIGGMIPAGD